MSLQKDFEENDFVDEGQFEEELLFRQGFETSVMEIEDGEDFEIPEGMYACVLMNENEDDNEFEDEEEYELYVEVDEGMWEKEPIQGNLQSGLYALEGHMIKVIELYDVD